MQKRAFERIPANIRVRFFSGASDYFGTVTNLSEKGMFIRTELNVPLEQQLEILIPLKEEVLKVPAKIISVRKSDKFNSGIGIVLLKPSHNYLEFVDSLRTALYL
ncbi:MAG: PilZ domain-containing protein [Promethearchaeota archaeon]|jgi:hypothetical protein